MLIFISNEPRTYAWGSKDAIPEILQKPPTGQPQAELWLGDHQGDPAVVDNFHAEPLTLIDLIKRNPEVYGFDGGPLPFLLKILGIGGPLSLQVHPNIEQAKAGYQEENEQGIPLNDPKRSFKDKNHKPELLVALTPVRALKGFQKTADLATELTAIVNHAGTCGATGAQAFYSLILMLKTKTPKEARAAMLDWVFSATKPVTDALKALQKIFSQETYEIPGLKPARVKVMRELLQQYPNDPGVLVALMTNLIEIKPGEALFVAAGEIHAYLSGVAIEVMASSDNVLRAGLTPKYVNIKKMREILTLEENEAAPFAGKQEQIGLTSWKPDIADFALYRVTVAPPDAPFEKITNNRFIEAAETVQMTVQNPAVMIATEGQLIVERFTETQTKTAPIEVARVRRGQSIYISSGDAVEISGSGTAFIATVA